MRSITAFLAAEHLNDLLREAEEARRAALVRAATEGSARPSPIARAAAATRRLGGAVRRAGGATPARA